MCGEKSLGNPSELCRFCFMPVPDLAGSVARPTAHTGRKIGDQDHRRQVKWNHSDTATIHGPNARWAIRSRRRLYQTAPNSVGVAGCRCQAANGDAGDRWLLRLLLSFCYTVRVGCLHSLFVSTCKFMLLLSPSGTSRCVALPCLSPESCRPISASRHSIEQIWKAILRKIFKTADFPDQTDRISTHSR